MPDPELAVHDRQWVRMRAHMITAGGVMAPRFVLDKRTGVLGGLCIRTWKKFACRQRRKLRIHLSGQLNSGENRRQILACRIGAFGEVVEVDDRRIPGVA